MVSTQNLGYAFRRVMNGWVERSVRAERFSAIFLPTRLSLTILGNVFTLTFRTAIYNYLSDHVSMIPSVKYLLPYLEQFRTALEPKPKNSTRKIWPGRKAGSYEWYELQDTVAYHDEFEKPKIIWSDITKLPRFSWDSDGQYINQKCYLIANQHPSLLAILQSRVNWFNISQICTPLRLRAGLWQY